MASEAISSHPLSNLPPTLDQHASQSQNFIHGDIETAISSRSRNDYSFPEGGTRAWLVILGSFFIIMGTFGLISSVGLFQSYWSTHQLLSYTDRDIGWISAVNVFLNLFLGVQVGPLFDRYGPRWLVLGGSVLYFASLMLLAQCRVYWQLMLVYGVLGGVSSAFLTTTALAVVAHWFEKRRGIASGIAFVGSSVGGIMFPLVLKPALQHLSWTWAIRLVGLMVLVMMIVGNICIRGRLPPRRNGGAIDLRCFQDARFSWATLGVSCKLNLRDSVSLMLNSDISGFEFVLFGALGLLPTYALGQGFSTQTSFNIIAILNA
jgi:MFS family permease